ncbi:MAG: asparagine synthase [Rhodospirillales bacterium]|nr:MAG: asparagine synthase [Rhodospirillales bacterium]
MTVDLIRNRTDAAAGRLWGVCGWLGGSPPYSGREAALCTLHAMADPRWRRSRARVHAEPGAAVMLSDDTPGADIAAADGMTVALFGYPRWNTAASAETAAQSGHAAAALQAYRQDPDGLLSDLDGHFGLVVLDPARKRALIATDRAGIHPMFYARLPDGGVAFATSATALARHPADFSTVSPQAVFDYLFFYRVPAPLSIFEGQRKLMAAQALRVADGQHRLDFYWQMPFRSDGERDRTRLKNGLFHALRQAVRDGAGGADWAKTGAFLSGGLDSSAVVGLLSELSAEPAKAFTVGFDHEAYDETGYARIVAEAFGATHYVHRVTDDHVLESVTRIAEAYDEPFGNSSAVAVYHCAKFAQEHGIELLLAGDGGDELFAGNQIYLRVKTFDLYRHLPGPVRRSLIDPMVDRLTRLDWFLPWRKVRRYVSQANMPMPERMVEAQLGTYLGAGDVLEPRLTHAVDPGHPIDLLREVYHRPHDAALEQRMHQLELQTVMADNDLRKVNRMCELAGIRVRFPMLDTRVMTFSAGIPPQFLLEGLQLRAFYKRALRGFLPKATIAKRKHGFGLPSAPWLAPGTRLHQLACDSLASLKRRGVVNKDFIEGILERHRRTGHKVDAGPIWDLMMLELWWQAHGGATAAGTDHAAPWTDGQSDRDRMPTARAG